LAFVSEHIDAQQRALASQHLMAHRLLCVAPAMALRALVRPRCVQAVRPASRVQERAGARSTLRRWCSLSLHNVPTAPRIGVLPTCGEERVRCFSTVSGAPPSERHDVSVGVLVEGRPLRRDRCSAARVLQAALAWLNLHVRKWQQTCGT